MLVISISEQAVAAVIGALAAVAGGLVAGTITYATECVRLRESRTEKSAAALADMGARYLTAVDQWGAWAAFMAHKQPGTNEKEWALTRDGLNRRVTELRDAEARLQLFCSEGLQSWIFSTLLLVSSALNAALEDAIERRSGTTERMRNALDRFSEGYLELIKKLRAEVQLARD